MPRLALRGRWVWNGYTPVCNFCSREISQVERMIAGECHVCNDCIDALHGALRPSIGSETHEKERQTSGIKSETTHRFVPIKSVYR